MARLPANFDLAEGFYKQACYDFFHGYSIRRVLKQYARALSLAQFQQAAEKAMKAAAIWDTTKRVGPDEPVLLSHQVWMDVVSKKDHLRALKNSLLDSLGAPEEKILELERYAPHGSTGDPNTEYPWSSGGNVFVPAQYFSDELRKDTVEQMEGIAQAIVLNIRGRNRKFGVAYDLIQVQVRRLSNEITDTESNQ